jgi:hypothetical protein
MPVQLAGTESAGAAPVLTGTEDERRATGAVEIVGGEAVGAPVASTAGADVVALPVGAPIIWKTVCAITVCRLSALHRVLAQRWRARVS